MALKILIVDDMPDAIEFLPNWLQREGYDTLIATRGQQALALAEENQPDLILLDVAMPGMDGIETCRRLRMNPSTADIPVILVSARSSSEARTEGLLAGATDYVTKPIHFPELLERVKRITDLHEGPGTDHHRLLEEITHTTLTTLSCSFVWLLVTDTERHWLTSQAIATEQGNTGAQILLDLVRGDRDELRFSLIPGDNPLAEVALNCTVLINIPILQLDDLPGGGSFYRAFAQVGLGYVSLLPLVASGRVVGVLVLAAKDAHTAESRSAQKMLNSLSSQAAMIIDNARLLADTASYEEQMQAEQSFRRMVLDTMGEGLIVADGEGRITYVNNRLLRMTDYTREMLYGRSVGLLFHPTQRDRLVKSLVSERNETLPFAQQLLTHHGEVVPVLLSRAVASDPDSYERSTVMVVTDLSELQRQEEALQLQTLRLQALNRASNAISSTRSLEEVITVTLHSALEVVQGITTSLLLCDAESPDSLVLQAMLGAQEDSLGARRVSLTSSLAGWVASTGRPQLVADASTEEQFQAGWTDVYNSDVQAAICVPLITSDGVIGVIEVINKHEGTFDIQDLETLENLSRSAAITISNIHLLEQTRRHVTELTTLLDASAAVSSTLDFGDILERIAHRLSLALQVDRVVITDWHQRSNRLEKLAEVVNAYWPPDRGPVFQAEYLPVTQAVMSSGQVVVADSPNSPEAATTLIEINSAGLQAVAGFPISIDKRVVGAVILYSEAWPEVLAPERTHAIANAIARWADGIRAGDARNWRSRHNLTDLCRHVLQTSKMRWCSVSYQDRSQQAVRLLCEVGRALWLERPGIIWDMEHYPSLARALETGEALTLQIDRLESDLQEQAYLRSAGGHTSLVAPLFIQGQASGLVKLVDSSHESRVFDNAEISLCQGIANVVGNAMENAQLYTVQEQRASALEAAYNELREIDQLKEELLQNLSHELRTPLTHILGYLRLIADGAFGPLTPETDETIQLVADKAQHLADLVKNIVTVQDAEASNLDLQPVRLERVLARAIRAVAGRAQAQNIRIIPFISDNLPLVYADPSRVEEVFCALLENAIKFSPNASRVEIGLEDTGGMMLHVCVRDYGVGIPSEEHDKIFQRFYQVDRGTTRRFGGTGLGLAIVRQVIEGHNGRVWVESQPGKGSRFHFTLPKATVVAQSD
jgi:PAS domain S-box-containing protein